MDFPRYVFTSPGNEKVKDGSYGTRLVQDEEEYDAALKAGFFSTMTEALESFKDVKKEEVKAQEVTENIKDTAIVDEPEKAMRRGRKPKAE